MPNENDRKYYTADGYDEDAYLADYREWEEWNDNRLRKEREERIKAEEAEYARTLALQSVGLATPKPQPVIQHTPYRSKESVINARHRIREYLNSELGRDSATKVYTEYDKQYEVVEGEIEKIKIHCDYKERVKPSAEEASVAKKIAEREKQIDVSKAKIIRVENQMETLRLQFEAKMRALEEEKRKSERYVEDTEEELARLRERETALKQPRVRISQADYTKLRTLKQVRLEKLSSNIDGWKEGIEKYDNQLKEALEAYYGTDFHKICEADMLNDFGKGLIDDLKDKDGEIDTFNFTCINNKWDYRGIYNKLRTKLDMKINDVNRLINNSEIP